MLLNTTTTLISCIVLFWMLVLPLKFSTDTSNNPQSLRVYFQNVGQGDSTLFVAPNGNSFLLDSGPFGNSAREEVGKNIPIFDNHIDVVLGTHPDSDHIGGFESVLKSYSTSLYVDPGFNSGTGIYENLIEKNSKLGIENFIARKGVQIILDKDEDVVFDIVFPDVGYIIEKYQNCLSGERKEKISKKNLKTNLKRLKNKKPKQTKNKTLSCSKKLLVDTNEISIVGQIRYGSTTVMMTGDAPASVEEYLIKIYNNTNRLRSQILKVGHHGSETSTSKNFLHAVSPDFAVISVGKENRYGHPNKKVLERLENSLKTKILRTDTVGHSIEFSTNGKTFVLKR